MIYTNLCVFGKMASQKGSFWFENKYRGYIESFGNLRKEREMACVRGFPEHVIEQYFVFFCTLGIGFGILTCESSRTTMSSRTGRRRPQNVNIPP